MHHFKCTRGASRGQRQSEVEDVSCTVWCVLLGSLVYFSTRPFLFLSTGRLGGAAGAGIKRHLGAARALLA